MLSDFFYVTLFSSKTKTKTSNIFQEKELTFLPYKSMSQIIFFFMHESERLDLFFYIQDMLSRHVIEQYTGSYLLNFQAFHLPLISIFNYSLSNYNEKEVCMILLLI
jgi:hypothetical protein